jgi:hypothetical protein
LTKVVIQNQGEHMKSMLPALLALGMAFNAQAQIVLSGSNYTQDFNDLESGLPSGWSIHSGATSSSVGSALEFNATKKSWGDTETVFKNYASANNSGATSASTATAQANFLDRALGIRQGAAPLDPGAAFVAHLTDTKGLQSFELALDLQMLSVQSRSTTWTIDYRIGDSGSFVPLGSYADPGVWGSTREAFSFGNLLDDQSDSVFIRVAALSPSSGSGSRDSFGIDNFSLTFSAIPEPSTYAMVAGGGLLGFAFIRRRLRRETA